MRQIIFRYVVRDYEPHAPKAMEAYLKEAYEKEKLELVTMTNSGCGHFCLVFKEMLTVQ